MEQSVSGGERIVKNPTQRRSSYQRYVGVNKSHVFVDLRPLFEVWSPGRWQSRADIGPASVDQPEGLWGSSYTAVNQEADRLSPTSLPTARIVALTTVNSAQAVDSPWIRPVRKVFF